MKILHLRASNFYGGPERQLHIHAILAGQAGMELIISSFSEGGKTPEFLDVIARDGIATHLFPVRNAYDVRAIGLVREYLREDKVDIICSHDYRSHLIVFRARKGTKAKWVAFSRGWTKDDLKVRIYHSLDKIFVRFADHVVAVSEAQKKKLERLMVPSGKITVAYNSIEPDRLATVERIDLRGRFNFPAESLVAIAGGRFSNEKGQETLVRAADEALKEDDRLRFVLFGDGPDLEKIRSMINRLGISDKMICPGFERSLLGCLKGADILINPSLSEGLPNIVLEGMALKVPVIATSVGGVPELITSGIDGVLVPEGDAAVLAAAIVRLSRDEKMRQRIIEAAFARVAESFSFKSQMAALSEVYKTVLAGA